MEQLELYENALKEQEEKRMLSKHMGAYLGAVNQMLKDFAPE